MQSTKAVGFYVAVTTVALDCATVNGQIAAIARSNGAAVATRNVRDFEGCGIDPWQDFPEERPAGNDT